MGQEETAMIKSFKELESNAKSRPAKRVALAMAEEADALSAIMSAAKLGIVEPILVGEKDQIASIAKQEGIDIGGVAIHQAVGEKESAYCAVSLIKEKKADCLMKGKLATSTIMKAALDKEKGLRGSGVLSHLTIIEAPSYHKLLILTDAALNIAPDFDTKVAIVTNAVDVARRMGVEKPKVAVICAVEKVNPAMPATLDAALLSKMADRGQIKNCLIDGPFALDNAISEKSCEVKGIKSAVGGDADILLMPEIVAANVMYKTIGYLTDYKMAGIIVGAEVPIILTSSADSDTTKYLSILAGISLI
jgi:phosphate butyryltransferase